MKHNLIFIKKIFFFKLEFTFFITKRRPALAYGYIKNFSSVDLEKQASLN